MHRPFPVALAGLMLATTSLTAAADFNRIATFEVIANLAEGGDATGPTSAEIIAAAADGMTLAYTDSPSGVVGLIDITEPAAPKPRGTVAVDGEPTSVAALGTGFVAAVNTSPDKVAPSGRLMLVDPATRTATASCDLGGQPDSIAVAPDGTFLAVAIENERDEDLDDGVIPQMPAGFVAIVPVTDGMPDCTGLVRAEVTGLAAVAPEDPEPEFVAIAADGRIAVTLQENNHVVILGREGKVLSHFPAGSVELSGIDTKRDGAIRLTGKATVPREPDAVKWLDGDRLVLANEGDYEGGARGFTIVSTAGDVLFESGAALEEEILRAGHYPEKRNKKGIEPEGLEVATFGERRMIFVLSERASLVGVYADTGAAPEFLGLLPSGVSPEGAVAIPARGLLATANEVDLVEDGGVRSHVMIHALTDAPAAYPTILSDRDADGRPIAWGALSGLAADPAVPGRLYAVSDSFYSMDPRILTIDATVKPARITAAMTVTRQGQPAQLLDLEGIAADGEGGFWLASEGRSDRLVPHALLRVDAEGALVEEIALPAELLAHEIRFGAEGVTVVDGMVWIALQRGWKDDPAGHVKLLAYDPAQKSWGAVHYPLEPAAEGTWNGLSEITRQGERVLIVERDNQVAASARHKKIYAVALADLVPAPLGGPLPVVAKTEVRDLMGDLSAWKGFTAEKVEGLAVDAAGEAFMVTDNDGVDDSSGETFFFSIGKP